METNRDYFLNSLIGKKVKAVVWKSFRTDREEYKTVTGILDFSDRDFKVVVAEETEEGIQERHYEVYPDTIQPYEEPKPLAQITFDQEEVDLVKDIVRWSVTPWNYETFYHFVMAYFNGEERATEFLLKVGLIERKQEGTEDETAA